MPVRAEALSRNAYLGPFLQGVGRATCVCRVVPGASLTPQLRGNVWIAHQVRTRRCGFIGKARGRWGVFLVLPTRVPPISEPICDNTEPLSKAARLLFSLNPIVFDILTACSAALSKFHRILLLVSRSFCVGHQKTDFVLDFKKSWGVGGGYLRITLAFWLTS